MLQRSRTPAAARARASRARRRVGKRMLRVETHERRLSAALRLAGRLTDDAAVADLEAAAAEILADYTARWLGNR
jgi:hypothetical protein